MLVRRHVPLLESTVSVRALRPLVASQCTRLPRLRYSSTAAAAHPERIAVLGGGIAGLASAFFASREFPDSKITVYESGKDIGGWLSSRRVQVPGGDVLFEAGPRTLRNAPPTVHLIQELGITDDLIFTKRSEPGAKNRFIYYPDRLNRLPSASPSFGDVYSLWRTGILEGFTGVIKEPLQPTRSAVLSDETVGSFLARRIDKRIANNIISAVFHGIYAGDIWQLSAKSLLSQAWQLEDRYGSAFGGYMKLQKESTNGQPQALAHPFDIEYSRAVNEEIDLGLELAQNMKDASMFTWKDGLQTLVTGLKDAMEKTGNIEIKLNSPVSSVEMAEGGEQKVQVSAGSDANQTTATYDSVLSTLRDRDLTPFVNVMTVNLFFSNPSLLPVEGFGYLLPQSIPFEQNPERALGVIFDNSAVRGQDSVPGTKLTVMLGGHWWNDFEGFPDEEEGLAMARAVLERHLGITDEPVAHQVNLSKDCIPQYTIGYEERLRSCAAGLQDKFKGRLRVVGAQVSGVGVNDCIAGAWNVVRGLRGDGWRGSSCGLDRVQDSRPWQVVDASSLAYKRKVQIKRESDP
ncbi:protoporphyrinogen oxidase [Didymella exigua CBS 183.55]|uniref:Protoporphyrinogen oxidase n=1 Tax=Didymella exigua CBS 183.55 TaxID=1150837 RepID=A0A6A5R8G2_9PLEO|nr:protoporphyrinogen oxidase [Didymella exigua CBS 183.55]KAF1923468.1 protoporphyrinogen oxidase [Didymella exigua CBS 183.55]